MTTIAVTKKEIACDLQYTFGNMKFKGDSKIIKVPEKTSQKVFGQDVVYIGFAGEAGSWGQVVSWLHYPEEALPRCKNLELIMLNGNCEIWLGNNLRNWTEVKQPYFAIGSGTPYAIAALAAGKSAKEAIKISSKFDPNSGLGVKTYSL